MQAEDHVAIPGTFRGFDSHGEVRVYRRNLPHWRQDGATYFVIFRLADSLPQSALRDLKFEVESFSTAAKELRSSGKDTHQLTENFYKRYGALLDRYLDAGVGECELRNPDNSEITMHTMRHFNGQHFDLYSAVVMPNHCHVLLKPYKGVSLEETLRSWKGFSARSINKSTGRESTLWKGDSFDRIIRDEAHFRNVVRYCRKNPKKANLPADAYRYWEASLS